jgi:hypothetical protein
MPSEIRVVATAMKWWSGSFLSMVAIKFIVAVAKLSVLL